MELSSRLIQENILLAKMEFSQGHLCFFDIYGDCVDCLMGKHNRGIQIIKLQDKYQMCTNKDYSSFIKKVLEPKKKKSLTQTTLETLTIIAYKQPITKVEIEDIRGVKSDKAIQTLLENNLIKEAGRLEKIGKPIIYKTTDEFLKLLNIEKLEDLPPIENYENDNE